MEHSVFFSSSVTAPPRSSRMATAIVLSVIGALSLSMIAPGIVGNWVLAALAVLLFLAIISKALYATHIALLALIWVLAVGFVPYIQLWPLNPLAPLIVYGLVAILTPPLRRSVGWLRTGHFGREVRILLLRPDDI